MENFSKVNGEEVGSQNSDYQDLEVADQYKEKPPIRVLDSELNDIDDPEAMERASSLLEKQIEFVVEKYGVDKKLLQTKLENISVIKWFPGAPYTVIYNGEKTQIKGDRGAAAFCNYMTQSYNGDSWDFKVAVFFDDMVDDHVLSHELFHALSTNGNMRFGNNDIGYDKKGVSIIGYNRKDEEVDPLLKAKGLNEGFTELLVTQFSSDERPNQYEPQVYLCNILISPNNNNKLVNAYFSDDVSDFRAFLRDFDGRQSSARSEDLVKMDTSTNKPVPLDILQACIEYTISYCDNVEQLKMERKRLIPILDKILVHNKFNDSSNEQEMVNMVTDVLLSKKDELLKK